MGRLGNLQSFNTNVFRYYCAHLVSFIYFYYRLTPLDYKKTTNEIYHYNKETLWRRRQPKALTHAILFDSLIWLDKLLHSFISLDPSTAKGMEIAIPLQRKLIKSDFVRHMMFSEISKFLSVLTDNNCYYLIHNWIPKEELLLISNEPFFFRKWQWRSQSYEILSSLGKTNADKRGTTHQKYRMRRNGTVRARDGERVARHDKACKKLSMTLWLSQGFTV